MVARWLGSLALAALLLPGTARGVTPESPEVRKVIDRGLSYLESAPSDRRLGGKCVVALALLKADRGKQHPKVIEAIDACKAAAEREPDAISEDIYSTGLAVILLVAADAYEYRPQIETFLKSLELRQKPHGGWGYKNRETGDTSMTQYAVLSSWEARQSGIRMPIESIQKVANWLLRTQDPSGVWGYQGIDPGNFTPVEQKETRISMGAAGLGSALICADLLGLIQLETAQDDGLPTALKLVRKPQDKRADDAMVDPGRMQAAVDKAERWLHVNFEVAPSSWRHYYLYALERAMSFHELSQGKTRKEAPWYNAGFAHLAETQRDDGSWKSSGSGEVVDTGFAVLFLLRSTRKSIEKYHDLGDGMLVGGRGLPSNLVDVKLRRGRIVDSQFGAKAEDLVQILSNPEHPDFDYLAENPEMLALSEAADERRGQIGRLERLARGGEPEARRAAVEALGRSDDLDVVPTLIYALSDGDWRVVRAARNALRLVSRDFDGFGLPERPDAQQLQSASEQWKSWYRTIRPDAID